MNVIYSNKFLFTFPDNQNANAATGTGHGVNELFPNQYLNTSSDDEDNEDEITFVSLLDDFSKKWLELQLTHHVSLAASNQFWNLAIKQIHEIFKKKEQEKVKRKIPQFLHVRKMIYKDLCPEIKMSFVFLNKLDGSLIRVNGEQTPLSQFQRDPNYQKLFEEAHIEVKI